MYNVVLLGRLCCLPLFLWKAYCIVLLTIYPPFSYLPFNHLIIRQNFSNSAVSNLLRMNHVHQGLGFLGTSSIVSGPGSIDGG